MKIDMRYSVWFFITVTVLTACKPKVPSEFIQPDEMEDILYDYHIAQAMARQNNDGHEASINRTKYFYAVLQKYDRTEAEFDSSLVYYYSHLPRLKDIYQEVNERLLDQAKFLGASTGEINRYAQNSASGDTANIWSGASDILLIPRPTANRYDFTIKVDTSFHKGDSFMFQFMSDYIWQTGAKDAVVCIVTKYEGDSIIQTSNHVTVSGLSQIHVPANNENKLKSMTGFIYLLSDQEKQSNVRRMMFINQLQLIRFHHDKKDVETLNNSTKTDSIQRTDNPGRREADTLRHSIVGKPGERLLPVERRIAVH